MYPVDLVFKIFVILFSGYSKEARAFKEAANYPFRPEASKTIVAVVTSDCNKAVLPVCKQFILVLLSIFSIKIFIKNNRCLG